MAEVKVTKTTEEKPGMVPWTALQTPLFRGNLFSVNPFALMREFTDEMDRMFGAMPKAKEPELWMPTVEVKKSNGDLKVKAELPGMGKEDIKVSVTEEALVLEGERKEEKEEKGEEYYRSERSYGKFYRAIPLPKGSDVDKAKAEFANGMLEVTIPCPESKPKLKDVPVQEGPPPPAKAAA